MAAYQRKVLVLGGGIAGMSFALRMRAQGCAVTLVEADPHWRVAGAGITVTGPTHRAFKRLGVIDEIREAGFRIVTGARFCTPDGKILGGPPMGFPMPDPNAPKPTPTNAWPRPSIASAKLPHAPGGGFCAIFRPRIPYDATKLRTFYSSYADYAAKFEAARRRPCARGGCSRRMPTRSVPAATRQIFVEAIRRALRGLPGRTA